MGRMMWCSNVPLLSPPLLPVPLLPLVQLLENGFQLQPLTIKNNLELVSLTSSRHDTELLPMGTFDTQFRLVVTLISNKDNPERHPGLHINLWFERRDLPVYRKSTTYMLGRRQGRDVGDEYCCRRWWTRRILIILFVCRTC